MHILLLIGGFLVICVMTSTREGRAEASERLSVLNWPLGIITAILWALILFT